VADCIFCGSSSVLAQEANRNALRPESLIPLDVGRDQVQRAFRGWLKRLWFRPSALKKLARFDAVGVYVPYWTFDARVHSDWSADAGHYYYETETHTVWRDGKPHVETRTVQKVRWVPAWGDREDAYDDLLVHASGGVSEELARELGPYDTSALVPYRPEYLAGWRAEEYGVDLSTAWVRGRDEIVRMQEERCAGDVPGDTYRGLRVSNTFDAVRWKHVLLPMWTLTYRFRGKAYTVLVHGQNGSVHGKAPWSWVKILFFALGLAALGLVALVATAG
jgi:hypothetical protein